MPTPPEIIATLEGNRDPDALVLLHLAKAGSDLRKPHEPDFAFFVIGHPTALELAHDLTELCFDVDISETENVNSEYAVVAKCLMVLDLHTLNQLSIQFGNLAVKYNAIYDGWGTEVVE